MPAQIGRRSVNTATSESRTSGTSTAASFEPGASIAAASSGVRRYSRTRLLSGEREPSLLIVDFQNDFTEGGALAVPDGDGSLRG